MGEGASPKFTLRLAAPEDQEPIRALIQAARLNQIGLHWRRFLVAVDEDGRLIGCGQVKPHRGGVRELASLAVVRAWRRQGVARAIVHRLQAGEQPPLWLICISKLIPFYEQFGFVEVTARRQMPRFFRLAAGLFNLYLRLSRKPFYLAVMVWQTPLPALDP